MSAASFSDIIDTLLTATDTYAPYTHTKDQIDYYGYGSKIHAPSRNIQFNWHPLHEYRVLKCAGTVGIIIHHSNKANAQVAMNQFKLQGKLEAASFIQVPCAPETANPRTPALPIQLVILDGDRSCRWMADLNGVAMAAGAVYLRTRGYYPTLEQWNAIADRFPEAKGVWLHDADTLATYQKAMRIYKSSRIKGKGINWFANGTIADSGKLESETNPVEYLQTQLKNGSVRAMYSLNINVEYMLNRSIREPFQKRKAVVLVEDEKGPLVFGKQWQAKFDIGDKSLVSDDSTDGESSLASHWSFPLPIWSGSKDRNLLAVEEIRPYPYKQYTIESCKDFFPAHIHAIGASITWRFAKFLAGPSIMAVFPQSGPPTTLNSPAPTVRRIDDIKNYDGFTPYGEWMISENYTGQDYVVTKQTSVRAIIDETSYIFTFSKSMRIPEGTRVILDGYVFNLRVTDVKDNTYTMVSDPVPIKLLDMGVLYRMWNNHIGNAIDMKYADSETLARRFGFTVIIADDDTEYVGMDSVIRMFKTPSDNKKNTPEFRAMRESASAYLARQLIAIVTLLRDTGLVHGNISKKYMMVNMATGAIHLTDFDLACESKVEQQVLERSEVPGRESILEEWYMNGRDYDLVRTWRTVKQLDSTLKPVFFKLVSSQNARNALDITDSALDLVKYRRNNRLKEAYDMEAVAYRYDTTKSLFPYALFFKPDMLCAIKKIPNASLVLNGIVQHHMIDFTPPEHPMPRPAEAVLVDGRILEYNTSKVEIDSMHILLQTKRLPEFGVFEYDNGRVYLGVSAPCTRLSELTGELSPEDQYLLARAVTQLFHSLYNKSICPKQVGPERIVVNIKTMDARLLDVSRCREINEETGFLTAFKRMQYCIWWLLQHVSTSCQIVSKPND